MKDIVADAGLVACCGLYCGACGSYRRGRCPGCRGNAKATWCKVRSCCLEGGRSTCAACAESTDPKACRKFHNVIARVIGFLLGSDRAACIRQIRELGVEGHAQAMAARGRHSLPRS